MELGVKLVKRGADRFGFQTWCNCPSLNFSVSGSSLELCGARSMWFWTKVVVASLKAICCCESLVKGHTAKSYLELGEKVVQSGVG
jgi:hypothetical protein